MNPTATKILDAGRACLLADGYAALSTRSVAEAAGVPLSQIHYHFGSKEELILAVLRHENARVIGRQREMFVRSLPLSRRWALACDYFDEDIESGYVRVLMEMTAAGWSSEPIRKEVGAIYEEWATLLTDVAAEAQAAGMGYAPITPAQMAALVSAVFIGSEALILADMEGSLLPFRRALRNVATLIERVEAS